MSVTFISGIFLTYVRSRCSAELSTRLSSPSPPRLGLAAHVLRQVYDPQDACDLSSRTRDHSPAVDNDESQKILDFDARDRPCRARSISLSLASTSRFHASQDWLLLRLCGRCPLASEYFLEYIGVGSERCRQRKNGRS